ncbi:MAG: SEC-C domain-containing protein [Clostridiales bacterium]|nr:SEC-C domain-containing protein [Clostridiales bacterium]
MAGYVIKITLENTKPPVWRRVLIPDAISFYDLHWVIQTAFGWENDHLHDFRPAGSDFRISSKEAMSFPGDGFDEDAMTVDDFLKSSRWIRYTYDFGDNWRHKIELEGEEPDYRERHAVILKAKGDNFVEDCAWDESARTVFSLLDANLDLAGMSFPKKKPSEKQKTICEYLQDKKEIENLYEETRRLQRQLERAVKVRDRELNADQKESKIKQLIHQWKLFCVGYENHQEEMKGTGTDTHKEYEQISLPGIEVREKISRVRLTDEFFLSAESYRVDVTRSEKEVRQLMVNASADDLTDYCRYMAIERSRYSGNKSKSAKAELLTEVMRTHPEIIFYIFSIDEYKWMRKVCFSPAQDIDISEMIPCVTKLMALGFVRMRFWMENGTAVAELETAADLESILPREKGSRLDRYYRVIDEADDVILSLLLFLGKAELDYIYETYGYCLKMFPEKADYLRFIYGHYTFPERAFTGRDYRGQPMIVHPGLNPQKIMEKCFVYERGLEYKLYSKSELDIISDGVCYYYDAWELYDAMLRDSADMPESEADKRFSQAFSHVLHGSTLEEIRQEYTENAFKSAETHLDRRVDLWIQSMQVAMETALPMFRGHSRNDLLDLGRDVNEIALFSEREWKKPQKRTCLFDLEPEVQIRLYRLFEDEWDEEESHAEAYDEILEELGCANYEVRWLRVVDELMIGDYDRAESEVRAISAELKDKKLLKCLEEMQFFREIAADADDFERELLSAEKGSASDYFGWDEPSDTPNVPYRRETPKIGRNDPCPCGSGKKYKKCCGRT